MEIICKSCEFEYIIKMIQHYDEPMLALTKERTKYTQCKNETIFKARRTKTTNKQTEIFKRREKKTHSQQ